MIFELDHIIPKPLENQIEQNSIWNTSCQLVTDKNYIVLAESGKGKSTLTSFLYGLRTDYTGELNIDGKNTKDFSLNDWSFLRKSKLSIVFQDLKLFGEYTLLENLWVKNEITQHKTNAEIMALVEKLGLKGKEKQLCETLSYGQQQRVAIIRALLQPFEFLLLDEPFSHLDEVNSKLALELIEEECKKNKAHFLITSLGNNHQLSNIERIII